MAESVLIVDDEIELLEIMAERLRLRGMKVSTTTSAIDALKMVESESYDAVVLDLMMPEMDGIKAFKALKQINPKFNIKTDLIVGFPSETDSDFQASLEMLRESRIDHVLLIKYTDRAGTAAAQMADHVEERLIRRRVRKAFLFLWKHGISSAYI